MHELIRSEPRLPVTELIPAALREGRRRMLALVLLFTLMALATLAWGFFAPGKYYASASIHVSQDNIIQTLMDGRAIPTAVHDRALIAEEIIFGRRVMDRVMEAGGWLDDNPGKAEYNRRTEQVKGRTRVSTPQENLIVFVYHDQDPDRARQTAQLFADLFLEESHRAQVAESRAAWEFIAGQVSRYHQRLLNAEERLKDFRDRTPEARPGTDVDVMVRVGELRRQVETGRTELMDLRSRERILVEQLSQEAATFGVRNQESMLRQRIAALQDDLEQMRMELTENHPDVVRTRYQIEDLRDDLEALQRRGSPISGFEDDRRFQVNPLYQDIQRSLAEVRRDISGLQSRIETSQQHLEDELGRGRRVADSESDLAELTRDYEVNQLLYQDLLERMENARLSMEMDMEGQGRAFRLHEPASLPAHSAGPRFAHVAAGGLMAAVATPLGLLLLLVRLDPRVRSPGELRRQTELPVLTALPAYHTQRDQNRLRRRVALATGFVMLVMVAYAVTGYLKLVQAP